MIGSLQLRRCFMFESANLSIVMMPFCSCMISMAGEERFPGMNMLVWFQSPQSTKTQLLLWNGPLRLLKIHFSPQISSRHKILIFLYDWRVRKGDAYHCTLLPSAILDNYIKDDSKPTRFPTLWVRRRNIYRTQSYSCFAKRFPRLEPEKGH